MMVTLKYVIVILHADNEGEGGTFSCYSLLSRYANISSRDPREAPLVRIERYQTNEMHRSNLGVRNFMERSKVFKALLKVIGVLAVTMVMSDGVLTPAQSVLGAYQGLDAAVPNISHGAVVGATCGTLVLLFLIQPFGTGKIGTTFAPIIIIWLGFLGSFGIYNLAHHDWRVLKAFNPGEAFMYLIRNKTDGWRSLGGVLLAFTGVEALFADLGAFSRRAIQISWLCWCLPMLLLAYSGQAAYIASDISGQISGLGTNQGQSYTNPVFLTVPPGMLIPTLVFAVLAAIVASQAIITATFQLMSQIIKLSYFPQVEVRHTSKTHHNQLYVPLVNYLLCIGTVIIAAVFKNTTALGNAYGVCVMFVTFFDTCMTSLVALLVWKIPSYYVIIPALTIACMDGAFLSSVLTKVPQGGWFTLTLAAVLASVLILWRYGKDNQWIAEAKDRKPLPEFLRIDENGEYRLLARNGGKGGEVLSINRGFGIFFDKGGMNTPMVFSQFINKLVSTPEVIVFFHMRPLEYPTVPADERFIVSQIKFLPNCYRVVCRHGFMDEVVTPDLASIIFERVRRYVMSKQRAGPATHNRSPSPQRPIDGSSVDGDTFVLDEKQAQLESEKTSTCHAVGEVSDISLGLLQSAFDHRVLYVLGKEEMFVREGTNLWRKLLLKTFLFFRDNTRTKIANLKVPTDRVVEIGFAKDI
ncbi:potassium transporter [Teratosphaeria nubilosa]|uniref:Potassium transporter n=1 Tax=Teratosphaeria nubilosa TaxID=161662 RepID=A0A6G1L7H6_9PEZI|nr:potassium transporter [Teratosphaeria nubilosa]